SRRRHTRFSRDWSSDVCSSDLRLRTLTALEVGKLTEERTELLKRIEELESILASEKKQYSVIKRDLLEMKKRFGDARRSEIIERSEERRVGKECGAGRCAQRAA